MCGITLMTDQQSIDDVLGTREYILLTSKLQKSKTSVDSSGTKLSAVRGHLVQERCNNAILYCHCMQGVGSNGAHDGPG